MSDSVRLELGYLDLSLTYLLPLDSKNQNLRFHLQPQSPSAISHQQFIIFFFTLREFILINTLKLRIKLKLYRELLFSKIIYLFIYFKEDRFLVLVFYYRFMETLKIILFVSDLH